MTEPVKLSEELASFLLEFAVAVQKQTMYPSDHPAVEPVVGRVLRRLQPLLAARGSLSLGVARGQLVIEDAATDPEQPLLHNLAWRLHRHQILALTFEQGLLAIELGGLLAELGVEPGRGFDPLGARPASELLRWPHVRVRAIRYDRLETVQEESIRPSGESPRSLWLVLARLALVEIGDAGPEGGVPGASGFGAFFPEVASAEMEPPSAREIARSIERHLEEGAEFAGPVVERLATIGRDLRVTEGEESEWLRGRVAELVRQMGPTARRRLLEAAGDRGLPLSFLFHGSHWMALQSVLDLTRAAGDARGQPVSPSLLRLFSKLARYASSDETSVPSAEAERTLREQVRALVADWNLEDPNPSAYSSVLQRLSREVPLVTFSTADAAELDPARVVRMSLETERYGPVVERAAAAMVAEDRVGELLQQLEEAGEENAVLSSLWDAAATPRSLRSVLDQRPPDFVALDRLIPRLGVAAAEPMLDLLTEADSMSVRRGLFSRLAGMSAGAVPAIAERLWDERWYVQRNMLALLAEIGAWPETLDMERFRRHAHPAVRREALKIAVNREEERAQAIVDALEDPDPRIRALALAAAESGCPAAAVPAVSRQLHDPGLADEMRAAAVRALEAAGTREAREELLGLVWKPRRWWSFWVRRLADADPVTREAIAALGRRWPGEPQVRQALQRAARSRDPATREAAAAGEASGGAP